MASELQREVERHVPGDVRRAVGAIQPAREIQTVDVDGARTVPARDRRVECERALHGAAGAGELQIGRSWLTGPSSDVSKELSTAMFFRPRMTPAHS